MIKESDLQIAALEARITKLEAQIIPLLERDAAAREADQGMIDILEAKGEGWKRLSDEN